MIPSFEEFYESYKIDKEKSLNNNGGGWIQINDPKEKRPTAKKLSPEEREEWYAKHGKGDLSEITIENYKKGIWKRIVIDPSLTYYIG